MKIKQLTLNSYGKIKDKTIHLKDHLNLIYGKNEAGKTTIKKAINTLLYGIYPTAKENNNDVNWENHQLSIAGDFVIDDQTYQVVRELKSSPIGRVYVDENSKNIRNKNFDFVKTIPNHIYDHVFSLDASDLNNLDHETWEQIENKLIFSYDDDYILDPNVVLEQLNNELSDYWRENNMGNFRYKTLKKELKQLNTKKIEAVQYDRKMKDLTYRLDQLNHEKEKLIDTKDENNELIKSIENLLPYKELIDEKALLQSQLQQRKIYKTIDKNIIQSRENLEEQINTLQEDINSDEERILVLKNKIQTLSKKQQNILSNEELIAQINAEIDVLTYDKKSLADKKNVLKTEEKRYGELFYKLFNRDYTPEDFKTLEAFHMDSIHDKVKQSEQYNKMTDYLLVIGSIIGLILTFVLTIPVIGYLLFALLGIGIYRFYNNRTLKEALVIGEELIVPNTANTLNRLEQLKTQEYEIIRINQKIAQATEAIEKKEQAITDQLNQYIQGENFEIMIHRLLTEIKQLKEINTQNEKYLSSINELEISKATKVKKIQKLEKSLSTINDTLQTIGEGTIQEGLRIVEENNKISLAIETINEKLNHSKFINLKKEYEAFDGEISNKRLNSLRTATDKINETIESLNDQVIELNKELSTLKNKESLIEIETEIDIINNELQTIEAYKDEMLLMDAVIRQSNRKFKEENQPEIINRAAEYFEKFTTGKYQQIYFDAGDGNTIAIKTDNGIKALEQPFSQGTKDQLYLALRLGIIDFYEDSDIRLPLILDEVFVNWDEQRLINFLNLLEVIAKERQVIIFTCKKYLVDLFAREVNAHHLIKL